MTWDLTAAEKKAIEAQSLSSFPINVEEIRRTVATLLSEFGRYGFFDEYTVHNFDHVHEMLKCLDWLIPADTRAILTKSDWLILTLACYFHDLGLLVTRDEFDARHQSGFGEFCEKVLFSGVDGSDYRAKICEIDESRREKFLYQEFVRHNHAARVRGWIVGSPGVALGNARAAAEELDRLLRPLDSSIRNDLANVCESHNLSDLDNEQKYPLFQPYGRSVDESSNLQYVAILLRTADLIQITNQRAPTVLYRTINPKDPISQIEWLKQNAVKHIRPKPKTDRSGAVNADIQSDAMEIFAEFKEAEGFFGLTAYLQYAEKELQRSYSITEQSKKKLPKKYNFPWRYIDDSHIKAEGFLPQKYGFELDQARILDLLTGHTLYNDSAVVVRELAQNAIDAVRLQATIEGLSSDKVGKVDIRWNSASSELEVLDNGTGMTQEVIENHLLKVGSSRYQDPKFKEEFPSFSPISRFGIGVLSAFMIADTVEIITCSTGDQQARQISLRSVHGKYLIRLFDKNHPDAQMIGSHGTKFKLKLRASAQRIDILSAVRRWVIFPKCEVRVTLDGGAPSRVGFDTPKGALANYLSGEGAGLLGKATYKIEERELPGLTLAYALRYNPFFNDWSFVMFRERSERDEETPLPGTCVEGIAVEYTSPGFIGPSIVSIANATGAGAPKTNVARSSLEKTAEKDEVTKKVYDIYISQIDIEVHRLLTEEHHSLSRAMGEIPYMVSPFTTTQERVSNPTMFRDSLAKLRAFLLEEPNGRQSAALVDLKQRGSFWTVESPMTWSVENLVREMPGNITARSIFGLAGAETSQLPAGHLVQNISAFSFTRAVAEQAFEVIHIRGSETDRRVELEWKLKGEVLNWQSLSDIERRLEQLDARTSYALGYFFRDRRARQSGYDLRIAGPGVLFEGLEGYSAVSALGRTLCRHGIPAIEYALAFLKDTGFVSVVQTMIYLEILLSMFSHHKVDSSELQSDLDDLRRQLGGRGFHDYVPAWDGFSRAVLDSNLKLFDPSAWSRPTTQSKGQDEWINL
jgi:hypothetical protein